MKDIKEITKKLEEGISKVFTSSEYLNYLKVMSRFHQYSFRNSILIMMQKPNATLVAGYKAWQTKFKRHVKRGEKAIEIIAPCPMTITKVNEETGEVETIKFNKYRTASVFDISQTEGEELPTLEVNELYGDVKKFTLFMNALKGQASVPTVMVEDCDGARGYCSPTEIAIKKGMSEVQTIKTMVHELAHHLMVHTESKEDRATKEMEAESVAFVVTQHFGIDTSDYSFPYIAAWSGSKDNKVLERVLEKIQRTAERIIGECEKALA